MAYTSEYTGASIDAAIGKVAGIETGATRDQSDAEILAAFENENQGVSSTDSPEFAALTVGGVSRAATGVNADITSLTALDGSDLDMGGGYIVNDQSHIDQLALMPDDDLTDFLLAFAG